MSENVGQKEWLPMLKKEEVLLFIMLTLAALLVYLVLWWAGIPAAPVTPPPAKVATQPGFGAIIALIGLSAVAWLVVRRN
jgi:PGF-CTERM protein